MNNDILQTNWKSPSALASLPSDWQTMLDVETKQKLLNMYDVWEWQNSLRWIYATEHHVTSHGNPMTFDDKPYLRQIYFDQAQEIAVKKCVQVGVTEWALCEAFSLCERGYSVFYVIPKYLIRNTFVSNRIRRTINRVPYYQQKIADSSGTSESVAMYHYAEGVMKFASSETESDFGEFPADCFIIDEMHDCHPENILLAEDRLSASDLKLRRWIGNPSITDYGIDSEFAQSCQYEWHVPCLSCGDAQVLDMFTHVCRQTGNGLYELIDGEWDLNAGRDIQVYCSACGHVMNRLAEGRWVASYPERARSGYHLSKLFTPTTQISELWLKLVKGMSNRTILKNLKNRDLGLPHDEADFQFNREILDNCRSDYRMPQLSSETCTMGVDVGNALHVRISEWSGEGVRKAVHIGTVPDFEALHGLMKRYNVGCCVVDARPETRAATAFMSKYNRGKVWLCEYPNFSIEKQVEKIIPNTETRIVQVGRTQTLDDLVASYMEGKSVLPSDVLSIPDYYDQMTASVRVVEDRSGKPTSIWIHKRADHYFHAENYDLIAKALMRTGNYIRVMGGKSRRLKDEIPKLFADDDEGEKS